VLRRRGEVALTHLRSSARKWRDLLDTLRSILYIVVPPPPPSHHHHFSVIIYRHYGPSHDICSTPIGKHGGKGRRRRRRRRRRRSKGQEEKEQGCYALLEDPHAMPTI